MIEDDADQYLSREDFPGIQSRRFFSTFDYILWIAAVDSRDMLDNPLNKSKYTCCIEIYGNVLQV